MSDIQISIKENKNQVIPFFWTDERENEVSISVSLDGEGASVILVGIFLGTDTNTLRFNTSVTHNAPNTKSLTTLRGVFKDNSTFSNNGLVSIKKGAKNADGYFSSKVLLFDSARGKSIPSLEIDENELKAGHASTVGKPDEDQLFYLRSRGLTEKQAIDLLVMGFFTPLFRYLTTDDIQKISKKLLHIS